MMKSNHGFTLAVVVLMLLSPKLACAAAGVGYFQNPTWEQCFAESQAIVVGTVTRVKTEEVVVKGDEITDVTFDLKVSIVLYGRVKGESIRVRERSLHAWPPREGKTYLVCLKKQTSDRLLTAEQDVVKRVYHKQLIRDVNVPSVAAIRRAGKIWLMDDVEEQVAAIKTGCFSANRAFRSWCLRKLAGKTRGSDPGLFPIHLRIDAREARQIMLRTMLIDPDDCSVVTNGISMLYQENGFPESDVCYRLLLGLLDNYDSQSRAYRESSFPTIVRCLYRWFPNQGTTTVARLARLITDHEINGDYRSAALHAVRRYFASGSDELQARILELTEPHLFSNAESLSEIAGISVAQIAIACATRGDIPPRIARLLQDTGKMTKLASSRVIYGRRKAAEILASERKNDEASDKKPMGDEVDRTPRVLEGWYHQTCWGVGRLGESYLHPTLLKKMATYEGQLVRLGVTKSRATRSPKQRVILAVDKIERLPLPPIEFRARTVPRNVRAGQPFQLVVVGTNRNTEGLALYESSSRMMTCQPYPLPTNYPLGKFESWRRNEPSSVVSEYTRKQLYIKETNHRWDAWSIFAARPNFCFNQSSTNSIKSALLPDGSYAWITTVRDGLPAGTHEAKFRLNWVLAKPEVGSRHGKSRGEFIVWHRIEVAGDSSKNERGVGSSGGLTTLAISDIEITPADDGRYKLRLRLSPAKGKEVRVPTVTDSLTGKSDADKFAHTARLAGFTAHSSPVQLFGWRISSRNTPQKDILQLQVLPAEGVVVQGGFRKRSRFAKRMTRLVLRIATDQGIEDVVLTNAFHDTDDAAKTPFGPVTSGVKIRIRPTKRSFKQDERLAFNFQAVNVCGKPICWWTSLEGIGKNAMVEIDGQRFVPQDRKPVFDAPWAAGDSDDPFAGDDSDDTGASDDSAKPAQEPMAKLEPEPELVSGWFAQHTCNTPKETTVKLPPGLQLAKGRHTMRYMFISGGGTKTNRFGEAIPIIKGRIISNEIEFEIE